MLTDICLIMTIVISGLMAGLFFGWSCSVMPGFARLKDREFVSVMRETNRAIQNPVFFIAFFGAPSLLSLSTYLQYGSAPRFALLLAATVVYVSGTFGVTIFGNVPLNNALESFDPEAATVEDIARQRAGFERRWNIFNAVRTVASTLTLILTLIACVD